jgi:transcriptional regulator with XRE-family HTH domain
MESLGSTLKKTRESISLTLRQVEEATGISNAYLSQLENDKIKKPSANVLYKLADLYKIELNVLLSAAGIIKKVDSQGKTSNEWVNRIAFYAENLNDESKKEILNYIEFLVKKKNG